MKLQQLIMLSLGSMQMSMRKLNLRTILQLWCFAMLRKLLHPSIRVMTAHPVSVRVRVRVSLVLWCNAIVHTVLHVSTILESGRNLYVVIMIC